MQNYDTYTLLLLLLLTVEFDSQLIGGPPKGDTAGGGWAWEGGAAKQNISAECRFGHRVGQGRKALADSVDALVWQGTMEWAMAAERLAWWRFLAVLHKSYEWKWWERVTHRVWNTKAVACLFNASIKHAAPVTRFTNTPADVPFPCACVVVEGCLGHCVSSHLPP